MDMSDKDIQFWTALADAINSHGLAGIMAFILAYLRMIYDETEPRFSRQMLEAGLGACITVVVGLTAENFGASSGWSFA